MLLVAGALLSCTADPAHERDLAESSRDDSEVLTEDEPATSPEPSPAAQQTAAPVVDAGGAAQAPAVPSADAATTTTACTGPVTAVPEAVRTRLKLDPFYKKYIDANGLPVISSDKPDDRALKLACELLNDMLRKRDDVRQALIRNRARFAIIGRNEGTAEIPENGYRNRPQADIDYINRRARGMAGLAASCGEENILCLPGDRYYNESICLHEFAHTIAMYGLYSVDRTFQSRLSTAYNSAKTSGILDGTYRKENAQEYWAEGVQDFFDTNATARPTNGVHNQIHLQSQLRTYDPKLFALADESFPSDRRWPDCRAAKR